MNTVMSSTLQFRFPGVSFGTSGVRALVTQLTPDVIACYVHAFVGRMQRTGGLINGNTVLIGMDLRPSSPAIALSVCKALQHLGLQAEFLGALPTPALALHCLRSHAPGIMVTGSHIPFDRNGIKFYGPAGEILKEDEQAMLNMTIPEGLEAQLSEPEELPAPAMAASEAYIRRYVDFFGSDSLEGLRIGVYEHSAVGRDITRTILESLGATVLPFGRSDEFVPIDTEAVSEEDIRRAHRWCKEHHLDALVSTDGDGDRPLVFDAQGNFVRGDLLGLLCARALDIQALAVPVSCNTAIEKTGVFKRVMRTRIGSPFVIAGMNALAAGGDTLVAGFEANGGFLLGTCLPQLEALPTRDAMLPMISLLATANRTGRSIEELILELPPRFTHSDRIKNIPPEKSQALLSRLLNDKALQGEMFPTQGEATDIDTTDGVRITFADGNIAHLRASGNAPELRCYTESSSYLAAKELCERTLERIA